MEESMRYYVLVDRGFGTARIEEVEEGARYVRVERHSVDENEHVELDTASYEEAEEYLNKALKELEENWKPVYLVVSNNCNAQILDIDNYTRYAPAMHNAGYSTLHLVTESEDEAYKEYEKLQDWMDKDIFINDIRDEYQDRYSIDIGGIYDFEDLIGLDLESFKEASYQRAEYLKNRIYAREGIVEREEEPEYEIEEIGDDEAFEYVESDEDDREEDAEKEEREPEESIEHEVEDILDWEDEELEDWAEDCYEEE